MSAMYDMLPWLGVVSALSVFIAMIFFFGVRFQSREYALRALAKNELNIRNLSYELTVVVTRWHQLGIRLGIPSYELKKIDKDYPNNTERQMTETLSLWLRYSPSASWKDVVKVLHEMEETVLAERIHNKHIGGASKRCGKSIGNC